MRKIRITVVHRELYQDLVDSYGGASMKENGLPRCQTFHDGQTFEIEGPLRCPEGFCTWAWADLQRDFAMLLFGPPKVWERQPMLVCCTDGFRPVVFRAEHVSDETNPREGED